MKKRKGEGGKSREGLFLGPLQCFPKTQIEELDYPFDFFLAVSSMSV